MMKLEKTNEKTLKQEHVKELSEENNNNELEKEKNKTVLIINENKTNTYKVTKPSNLQIIVKKNINANIVLLIENASLNLETKLEKNSFAQIACFSEKGKILTKHNATCEENSKIEIINFTKTQLELETKTILEKNSSCSIINRYYNFEKNSNIKDEVIHKGKNTKSKIDTKGYLTNSTNYTKGLIKIEQDAQDAEGCQETSAILEGNSKTVSIPDLEIKNNEVKCSHGSTITRIKDEDLFYFESRGITKENAKKIIIEGHLLSNIPSTIIQRAENILREKI